MTTLQKHVAAGLAALFISFFIFVSGTYLGERLLPQQAPQLAGASFTPVQGTQFTVSQTVLPADTTVNLSSFTTPDGRPLTMSMFGQLGYATLDPTNSSRLETITFTGITQFANGSAQITGVARGVDFVSPYSASSTLSRTHLVGSNLILANTAAFYGQQFLFANQIGTSSAVLVFGSTTPPHYDLDPGASFWTTAASSTLVDLAQLQRTVLSGVTNASTIINGIVQLATAKQAASSTVNGSSGAFDVLQSSYATDTPSVNTNTSDVLMSDLTGHLKQGWLDLTQAFTVSGAWIFNSTATFNGTTAFNGTVSGIVTSNLGDGSNGSTTISGNTTLSSDMFYQNLTIQSGVTVNTNGWRIFATGTVQVLGTVANNGGNGGAGVNGAGSATPGAGGTASPSTQGFTVGFGVGACTGAGGSGTGTGGNGSVSSNFLGIGGNGGAGGAGSAGSNAGGGSGGTPVLLSSLNNLHDLNRAVSMLANATTSTQIYVGGGNCGGGGGGGGGGVGGGNAGGGGGGGGGTGGGVIFIAGNSVIVGASGVIQANGGNAGVGAGNNVGGAGCGGGGGGGGGGLIFILYANTFTNSGTIQASAGTGAVGGSVNCNSVAGTAGSNGSAGLIRTIKL